MNRRGFITGLVSSFFVLPSATTYARNPTFVDINKLWDEIVKYK